MIKTKLSPFQSFFNWVFNIQREEVHGDMRLDKFRFVVFIAMHIACLAVFFVGFSYTALILAIALYLSRMFFITAFYHRYFSHRAYRVSRPMQFLMALCGCTAGQRGPLWWASHHRHHHVHSDTENDPHSPDHGLVNSHMLWFLRRGNFPILYSKVKDWARFPELKLLEHIDWLPFLLLGVACYSLGEVLAVTSPQLQTNGMQLLVWGFFISTVLLYHATYTINSLSHKFGKRRFNTNDSSRNNWLLALITLGEGWHNNHHRYPASTRQGFYWWEIDISFFVLIVLHKLGLVQALRPVPDSVYREAKSR
ncbi:MAG: acyl-CoA desaturase [Pseudomonadota bacterium]